MVEWWNKWGNLALPHKFMLFCQRKTIVSKITPKLRPSKEVHQSTPFPSSMSFLLSLSVDSTYGICSVLPKGKRRTGFIKRRGTPPCATSRSCTIWRKMWQVIFSWCIEKRARQKREWKEPFFFIYLFLLLLSSPLRSSPLFCFERLVQIERSPTKGIFSN